MPTSPTGNFGFRGYPGEIRQTVRALRRSPWYSLTVVGVIALSMALTVTAYRLVDGVLFKPLPYPKAHEIHQVSGGYSPEVVAASGQTLVQSSGLSISARDVADLAAAVPTGRFTIVGGGSSGGTLGDLRTWSPNVRRVDSSFFDVMGVTPLIGGFASADFETPLDTVQPAIASYGVWQRQLSGRTDALGQILETETADGKPVRYRITGILPPHFLYPTATQQPDLLTALVLSPAQRTHRTERSFQAFVRLPPETPLADYQSRFDAVGRAGRQEIPDRTLNGGLGYWDRWAILPLSATMVATQRPTFWSVFVAAGVLLLLGCLNVSGLVAARNIERVRELALRRSLGARGRDITRLVVLECFTLIAAGAAIGLAGSEWLVSVGLRLLPPNLGLLRDPGIDWRVVTFVLASVAMSTLVVSLWPLRRSLRPRTSGAMGRAMTSRLVGRSAVITAQVALAFVLTVGGALVGASLLRIWQTDLGYVSSGLLVVDGTSVSTAPDARVSAVRDLLERIRRIQGVVAAGATQAPLLRGGSPGGEFKGDTYRVTRGFFETLAPQIVEGRLPTAEEFDTAQPIAVMSRSFASGHFPDGRAVGRLLTTPNGKESLTIIGVVEDARYAAWNSSGMNGRQVYRPLTDAARFSIAVRMTPDAESVLPSILRIASEVPTVRLTRAALADDLLQDTVRPQRFRSWVFGSLSLAALVIVGVGVLGLVAAMVVRRTREIGIRMALGSTSSGVVRLLLREQLIFVAIGLLVGALISYWTVGFVKSYLYETTPYDGTVWAAAVLVIVCVAGLGVLIPALRLGRTNVVQALRAD